uniref:SH3 domain and tetratricopeptide repeats 2 n=1 Tax=Latimeria chalumnae TaxID=7897 RepID=H3A6L8_LATCH
NMLQELLLTFSVVRRSSQLCDSELQKVVRKRLWILENDKEVTALFKELSARLVSIEAEKDAFVITFRTMEEIWKFSTYLALGYVGCCLEHFLFEQTFWLNFTLVEDVQISVKVNEEYLATIYLGLLLQESNFYARAVFSIQKTEDDDFSICKDELLMVRNVGEGDDCEGTSLSTGHRGLVPVATVQPLPYPFYQWFLKYYPGICDAPKEAVTHFPHAIGMGTCIAKVDHKAKGQDELNFCAGDRILIIGLYIYGLQWFVGKSLSNGNTGFVQTRHVTPDTFKPLERHLQFLTEDEKSTLFLPRTCTEEHAADLLNKLSQTNLSTVYRLGESSLIKNFQFNFSIDVSESSEDCQKTNRDLPKKNTGSSDLSNISQSTVIEDLFARFDEVDDPKFFIDLSVGDVEDSEVYDPILTFLNKDTYTEHFQTLYDISFSFLNSTFYGFSDEEELVQYLQVSREWARKRNMSWAQRRICFLLGRICAKQVKFSQARVYFEEAMNININGFSDPFLLSTLYINLAAIYLIQKRKQKSELIIEKATSLLLCLPQHVFSTENEFEVLKHVFKKAILVNSSHLEARTSFLIVRLLLLLEKYEDALPFVEHLQLLPISLSLQEKDVPVDLSLILNFLYDKKYLPRLTLASARLSSLEHRRNILTAVYQLDLVIQNILKLCGSQSGGYIPAQATLYLRQVLCYSHRTGNVRIQRDLCLSLSKIYHQYGALDGAITYLNRAIELGRHINEEAAFEPSVYLAWLYILDGQIEKATDLLNSLLESLHETDSPTQHGVVYNLSAITFRRENKFKSAAKNYYWALKNAEGAGNKHNQAISLANFGNMFLCCNSKTLAGMHLLKSVYLYSELQDNTSRVELVQVLLWLGQSYVGREKKDNGKLCYELALLIAMKSKNAHSQIQATKSLCYFFEKISPSQRPCIIYYEHWMSLAHQVNDREMESNVLEVLSQCYRALNTDKAFKKSLDYTKQSLRMLIDLGKTYKVAKTWLQAGRCYYMTQEHELVEMYLQVAIQNAHKLRNLPFLLRIYEEAGDVFYNGVRSREKAAAFYKNGAIPLAREIGDMGTELRLFNKLTELQISLETVEEALQFAVEAVRLSSAIGDKLKELVAYHRLATVYYLLQQFEMAENYYLKALTLFPHSLQHAEEAMYYMKVYCRLGNLTLCHFKDTHDAAGYFQLALAAAIELGNCQMILLINTKLARI